MINSLIEQLD